MKSSNLLRCKYCLRKISGKYVVCVPCKLELCSKCFCFGVEGGNHRKTHKYKVVIWKDNTSKVAWNNEKVSVFKESSKWNCDEEMELMNALSIYKSGNWTDISVMVHSKSPEECRQHFIENYLNGDFARNMTKEIKSSTRVMNTIAIYDHTGGTSSPLLYQTYPPPLMNPDEEKCLGYLPRRNEFLLEYNDSAEKLVCAIDSDENVESLITAIHVTLIDIYNWRVLHRNHRKRVALEHGLIYHLIAQILDKPPRDYNYFHRQLLKRTQPSSGRPMTYKQSLFGRNYVQRQRSFTMEPNHDTSSCEPSTPSENGHVTSTPASSTSQYFFSPDNNDRQWEERPFWYYNASLVDNRLKPFLRYLSSEETKEFLECLKKEETLKTEILTLQLCVSHGIKSAEDYQAKRAALVPRANGTPLVRLKTPKRKRGKQKCFQFICMMRKKRMDKYLAAMKRTPR